MLLLLRFTNEDNKNTEVEDYKEGPHLNSTSPAEQSERIGHNFLFPKDMKVNKDIFKSLSSLLSNSTDAEYFTLFTKEI